MKVEFWYDVVCPYAYLAATQVEDLAERTGSELLWRPMRLDAVLQPEPGNPARERIEATDLARWAEWYGVPLRIPEGHPRKTTLALRAILAAGDARAEATKAIFRAYWVRGEDVSDAQVLGRVLSDSGLEGAALVERAADPASEEALEALTQEAAGKGIFGVPSFVVGEELFWGQDRLRFVAKALAGWRVEPMEE